MLAVVWDRQPGIEPSFHHRPAGNLGRVIALLCALIFSSEQWIKQQHLSHRWVEDEKSHVCTALGTGALKVSAVSAIPVSLPKPLQPREAAAPTSDNCPWESHLLVLLLGVETSRGVVDN